MTYMKRYIKIAALILAVCLIAITAVACGSKDPGDETSGDITVTFDLNYDGAPAATKVTVASGDIVTPPSDPTRENYSFEGWFTDAACTEEADFEYEMTEDVTFYASWKQTTATVTFVFNNGTDDTLEVSVKLGDTVEQPNDPEYDGHALVGWYSDEACTTEYDFTSPVTGDTDIYAAWEEIDPDTALTVTFMWNYEGAPDGGVARTTEIGYNKRVTKYNAKRSGYDLKGWYTDADCTQMFDFQSKLTKDTVLYARWMEIVTFEAEYVDFTGVIGAGYSNVASGTQCIQKEQEGSNRGASNGYFAGYSYKKGYTLEFKITSDVAIEDAELVLRLSAEFYDMTYTCETFLVQVNGTNLEYDDISITNVPEQGTGEWAPFKNYTINESVSLDAGENTIKLIVNNEDRLGESGTMYSTAPLIDCMYIYSDSGVAWADGYPIYNV